MKTKIKLASIFSLFCFLSTVFAQDMGISNGPVPTLKQERTSERFESNADLVTAGYGYSATTQSILSAGGPCGFDFLAFWPTADYLSSMCQGGNGKYYVTGINGPSLYQLDTVNVSFVLLGNITGMGADVPNGISYNPVNGNYYIASSSNLFSFNVNSRVATLIGPFNTGGIMIDLCFDENGICYAYDIVTDAAYTINTSTGVATLLGPLGYDANFGQGMSYDFDTHTIYLTAFNNSTFTGQCRIMDQVTGNTTLISDWGLEQIDAFTLNTFFGPPCPVGTPSNPNPPDGTLNVPIYGSTLSWVNGSGTLDVEVWFGPYYNVVKVYDGPEISSFALPTLDYYTQYQWYVVCKNDTCANQGSIWNFTTQNSFGWVFDIYPLNIDYWTGTCDPTVKTQNSLVKADGNGYAGWMVFDTTPLGNDPNIIIISVEFNAYLYDNNWPYWAITPMGYVNPITGTASEVYSQVSTSYTEGTAYSYNPETGSLDNGWIQRELTDGGANQALENALSQGWFAIGLYDWDNSPIYYVRFQGWAEGNKPFLRVNYLYIPVELISFTAEVTNNLVTLFWQTATETNNSGFEVERSQMSKVKSQMEWQRIGFVEGKGTTTEIQSYSFTDKPEPGIYKYRLKQIDYDGSFANSPEVEAEVKAPNVFSLEQNYPNPFNPNTKIKYTIPASLNPSQGGTLMNVTLKVYDILGNEVATLVNEEQSPGTYEIEFKTVGTSRDLSLPSGIYFYQIKVSDPKTSSGQGFVETKKMILLK